MIVAGVDIGAGTAKSVILNNGQILAYCVIPTGANVARAAEDVMAQALDEAQFKMGAVEYIVSTGYGRNSVPFSKKAITEILCHAKGAYFLMPQTRTVVDIGCQDSKVIEVNDRGQVTNFVMNDKCAAGTGRFLEVMAHAMGIKLEEMGELALKSKKACPITSTCTVFAESEVVSLRAAGEQPEDLIAGIYTAIIKRVATMAGRIGFRKEVVFTGGVAKSIGARKALEERIGFQVFLPEEPQIIGALGASLFAEEEVANRAPTTR
jgi:predicted CoA-substrate-specific enzyme activase